MAEHTVKCIAGYTNINVFNLFLQRSLGDYYFDSIADFQNARASRLRLGGAVPSLDPNDAAATFSTQAYTFGIQDDWDVTDDLQITAGIRYDIFGNPERPPPMPNFLARHGFSNNQTLSGRDVISPRFGFNWQPIQRLIIRGGVGVFAGGTPDVFLSNSYSNTGQLTNAIDISRNTSPAGCNVTGANAAQICSAGPHRRQRQTFDPSVTNFLATNTASLAAAPVNAIDPDLDLASQLRATLSANYEANLGPLGDGWLFGVDFLYGNVIDAYQWTDLRSVVIGTLPDGRPRYGPLGGIATTNQDLLMTNNSRGRSYIGVVRLAKSWDFGLSVDAQLHPLRRHRHQRDHLGDGGLALQQQFLPRSEFRGLRPVDLRDHRPVQILASTSAHAFFGDYETRLSLFGEYRSGRPYSITSFDPSGGRLAVFGVVGTAARNLLVHSDGGRCARFVRHGRFGNGVQQCRPAIRPGALSRPHRAEELAVVARRLPARSASLPGPAGAGRAGLVPARAPPTVRRHRKCAQPARQ